MYGLICKMEPSASWDVTDSKAHVSAGTTLLGGWSPVLHGMLQLAHRVGLSDSRDLTPRIGVCYALSYLQCASPVPHADVCMVDTSSSAEGHTLCSQWLPPLPALSGRLLLAVDSALLSELFATLLGQEVVFWSCVCPSLWRDMFLSPSF